MPVGDVRPPVRCPHCSNQPAWREVKDPERHEDAPGQLGVHTIVGWRCNHCEYFLPVSQWES